MIWTKAKIFFPIGRLTEAFIEEYIARYSVEIDGPQNLDGQWMTLEPGEENHELSIVFVDNPRRAMFRKASAYDGTLDPVELKDPVTKELLGHTIEAYWPDIFLADLRRDPQPEPELFDGVYIVEEPNE